jgi:regulator of sirC expression with transglutaminase-like and TPR domain
MYAPGYTRVNVADPGYLASMDPAARFAEIINGASADRHLDLLCALIATAVDHSADASSIIVGLDRVAELCPPSFDGIVETLFTSGLFAGDSDDYHDPRNSLLHEVLARRVGMPITLSVVAMEVGKRHGVTIRGIGLPGHFVIRDKESGTFADPFGGGLRYDEPRMITSWRQRMGEDATFRPAMLSPTSAHEIVMRILNNLKHSLVARDQQVLLARLVPLRAAFVEFASERAEHRRWMRHFN